MRPSLLLTLLCAASILVLAVAADSSQPAFGHAMLPLFMLEDGYVNFNHGSFGSVPRSVIQAQQAYVAMMEARPDPWFRGGYQALLQTARAKMAAYVGADKDDVVFVENASSGVNSVLRSLSNTVLRNGGVLLLSTAYAMVPNTLRYLAGRENITMVQANVTFPLVNGGQDIVDLVSRTLATAPANMRLCIFSHITSVPSLVLPIADLATVCKARGLLVLIDGAHAPGQVPIDLNALMQTGVDFYVGNAHKWLFSPKGSAFLWVAPHQQALVAPTVVSSSGKTDFVGEYEYTGTRDYTAFCSVADALAFRAMLGDNAITAYNHNLAVAAGHALAQLWGTDVLVPDAMVGSMVNVRLPVTDPNVANALGQRLLDDYNFYVYPLQNAFWTRLSAQIYLEQDDFAHLGQVVRELVGQPERLLSWYRSRPGRRTYRLSNTGF